MRLVVVVSVCVCVELDVGQLVSPKTIARALEVVTRLSFVVIAED